MSLQVIVEGAVRELTPNELQHELGSLGLRPEHADIVAQHVERVTIEPIPLEGLGQAIGELVEEPLARIVGGSMQSEELVPMLQAQRVPLTPDSSSPRYVLVPARTDLRSRKRIEIAPHVIRRWSSFRDVPEDYRRIRQAAGNLALHRLAGTDWRPTLEGARDRHAAAKRIARTFCDVLEAAETHIFVRIDSDAPFVEPLPPGDVPQKVIEALEHFLEQLDFDDMLHPRVPAYLAKVAGTSAGFYELGDPPDELADLWTHLRRLRGVFEETAERLLDGKPSGFWLEHDELSKPESEVQLRLQTPSLSGVHVVGLPLPPAKNVSVDRTAPVKQDYPIAFSISDLHFGQGWLQKRRDNADDVYQELDTALVATIEQWGQIAVEHRSKNPNAPAWLVLNGDILDFWSADLRDAGAQIQADASVEENPFERYFRPSRADALGRMERIYRAHAAFFDSVRNWIDSHLLNFCVYTAGNHDDYLVRYALGADIARRIHSTRCVFAAKSFSLPSLNAIFEHGHRKDEFNIPRESMEGSSLGELQVSMTVNPVARGGISSIQHAWVQIQQFAPANGIDVHAVQALLGYYARLNAYRGVDQSTYEGWMGAINNIMPESEVRIATKVASRELMNANRTLAKKASVKGIDSTVKSIMRVWLEDSFHKLLDRIFGPVAVRAPMKAQTLLLDHIREVHREVLGFSTASGLNGMAIHVVGHTHDPSSTYPALAGTTVAAQHVNTGTAIDMFKGYKTPFLSELFFGETSSANALVPLETSLACLLVASETEPDWIYVYGSAYRSLQPPLPGNHQSVMRPVNRDRWNRLRRKVI